MSFEEMEDLVNELKESLPLPSEVKTERYIVPVPINKQRLSFNKLFMEITFEKEYHHGICIGWKYKSHQ